MSVAIPKNYELPKNARNPGAFDAKCKYCGQQKLRWLWNPTRSSWAMQEADGNFHKCKMKGLIKPVIDAVENQETSRVNYTIDAELEKFMRTEPEVLPEDYGEW
ncbi:hypothetical protein [Xanthomonas phage JGB6]|nr:hypothetical protein [Xanthomonas phage JGB6]